MEFGITCRRPIPRIQQTSLGESTRGMPMPVPNWISKREKKKTKELYAKVPSLDEDQRLNNLVQDFLNKDLEEKVLHYKELSALNFLILSFRLKCRPRPPLQLTWKNVSLQKMGRWRETAIKLGDSLMSLL